MKKLTLLITIIALSATTLTQAADGAKKEKRAEKRETKASIDDHIKDINKLDNKESSRLAGLRAVSHETAVGIPKLQDQLKEHPNAGIAGLLVANDIAVSGKKDASDVFKAHGNGKSWSEIAKDHSASVDSLETKLSRVESAMRDAK
jgi:Ni/Co efflux regulator RcnB